MRIVLSIFGQFFDIAQNCQLVNQKVIFDYISYLKQKQVGDISINSYIRGLRAIIYYFIDLDYTAPFKINLIRAEKPIKPTYTDRELELLLQKPNTKKSNFTEYRNWVIVNYLLGTGNRASTVINIKIGDIDFTAGTIILKKTKNRRQQIIPLSYSLLIILREYMKYREGGEDDYLFCNSYSQKLTRPALQHAIYCYNKSRGVIKTSIHLFRHTFAKKWILNRR